MLEGVAIGREEFAECLPIKRFRSSQPGTHHRLVDALDMQPPSALIGVMAKNPAEGTFTAAQALQRVFMELQQHEQFDLKLLSSRSRKISNVAVMGEDDAGQPITWKHIELLIGAIRDRLSGAILSIAFPEAGRLAESADDSPLLEQRFDFPRIEHIARSARTFLLSLGEQSSRSDREKALFVRGKYVPSVSGDPLVLDRLRGRYILRREDGKLVLEIAASVYEDIAVYTPHFDAALEKYRPGLSLLGEDHSNGRMIQLHEPVNVVLFTKLLDALDELYFADDAFSLPVLQDSRSDRDLCTQRAAITQALQHLFPRPQGLAG